jgi:hypothetical protein
MVRSSVNGRVDRTVPDCSHIAISTVSDKDKEKEDEVTVVVKGFWADASITCSLVAANK